MTCKVGGRYALLLFQRVVFILGGGGVSAFILSDLVLPFVIWVLHVLYLVYVLLNNFMMGIPFKIMHLGGFCNYLVAS